MGWFNKTKEGEKNTGEVIVDKTLEEIEAVVEESLLEEAIVEEKQEFSKALTSATGESEEELKKEFEQFKIQKLLHRIDHTLLKQDITNADLKRHCAEAERYGFYSVCIQPLHVDFVKRQLGENSRIKVCTVVGFPFGEETEQIKAIQTKRAVKAGADEIDMVMCISALKNGDFRYVKRDIRGVVRAAKKRPVKVIIEISLLTPKEIEQACSCVIAGGAAFVKTSTGYFGGGATVEAVKQIRGYVKNRASVKAAGGIRTAEDAVAMLNAGADRLGTSNGVAIAEGLQAGEGY